MLKKLILIVLLVGGQIASAQETYSVALNSAANVTKLDLGRVQYNEATCARYGISPGSCTQSAVCVAAGVTGGASCTAADALAAGVRIYANTLAGREGYMTNELVKSKLDEFQRLNGVKGLLTLKLFCQTANQTQKDQFCTDSG